MFLKQINLANFRNYTRLELLFDNKPTVLVGNNAAGKSNLLEAAYLLSSSKSTRAAAEDELIRQKELFCTVEGFTTDGSDTELLVVISKVDPGAICKKRLLVNGIARRSTDFIGHLPAVIFHPSDINMVSGPPSLRRWHLDLALAQIDPGYKRKLTLYEQFLISRNKVLKRIREGQGQLDELDYWTKGLVENAAVISGKRQDFFAFISSLPSPLGAFRFEYKQSNVSVQRLRQTLDREIAAAATLIGPHRDDFVFYLYDRNLAHFGSRGQQRLCALAFKLFQLEHMARVLAYRPLLLLDDVFSELDVYHRSQVVELVASQQTIIATVELENIPKSFLSSARILKVDEGKIVQQSL